jgi:hypothetical protein
MVFSLLCGILIALPGMAFAADTTLGMELWSRWTMSSGISAADSSSSVIKNNSLALERGYLDLKTKFSEQTSARFTVDMFSTDAHKDGAGLKLKYAFMDFGDIIPIPDAKLSVGLQKVYFGTIYDWDYTLIGKAPSDEYKLANSADYGISVNGYLPSGFGEYALGVYNGEGYKNFGSNLKDNTNMEFLANLRLTPITGLTLGGSFMTNSVEREKALATDLPVSGYQTQILIDALARVAYGPAVFTVEYLSKDVEYPNVNDGSKDYTASGISIIPVLNLRHYIEHDVQLVGRYDRWDETDNASNKHLLQAITGGINYNLMHNDSYSPALQLQLNATHKSYDADESAASYDHKLKDSLTVMAQLKWRFSSKL